MGLDLVFEGDIALLAFDHGKANEMGQAQLESFASLGDTLMEKGARALISYSRRVSRKGTPIFIAGANVTERQGWTNAEVAAHVRYQRAVLNGVRRLPIFHVTVVHGVALGWGTEFLLTADYRITTPTAKYGLPETGLGILPGAGGTAELWAMIGLPQAMRLAMTGERIDAAEALRIGLVQEEAADVDVGLDRARLLAGMVAKKSPTAIAAFKSAALDAVGQPPAVRQAIEARAYEHCLENGEAAIGRAHFKDIITGGTAPWGPLVPFDSTDTE